MLTFLKNPVLIHISVHISGANALDQEVWLQDNKELMIDYCFLLFEIAILFTLFSFLHLNE